MTELKLYFTRHGRTAYNEGIRNGVLIDGSPIVQSWSDGLENQLLNKYKFQESLKGKILAHSGLGNIIHSGMGRTEETAHLIAKEIYPIPKVNNNPSFKDMSFGYWDGLSLTELKNGKHAEDFRRWSDAEKRGDLDYKIRHEPELFANTTLFENTPAPESVYEVILRVGPEIDSLDEDSLIVSHGHATKAMLWHLSQNSDFSLSKEDFRNITTPNSALYRVKIAKNKIIEHYNYDTEKWVEGFM